MELKIQKWGNSAAIRLPALLLEQINVSIGTSLSVDVRPDGVMLKPARPKYSLDDLVAQCDTKAAMPEDLAAWGQSKPVGREAW
ncbi:AbrB/MazE/SpoVT family DNA-binding domain-containing protein [Paraburkholderia bannensis]|uniref:AbrB/MazE/SpoVT family DNA-binding domain-containing protein n=1 Tax=Paraburkholderia bannensis TaxID=765414 RepID=UPI002AB7F1EB|nr:AbrB/MazE/SpoVT family DNA-binding domain-containing protein [Paraburkholderia bannensis]